MIKAKLTTALDFAATKESRAIGFGWYSYRDRGQWRYVAYGPSFTNYYLVVEADDDGEESLRKAEDREATRSVAAAHAAVPGPVEPDGVP